MKYRAGQIITVPDPPWKNGPPDDPEPCALADMVVCDGNCNRCLMNEPDYEAMAEAKGLI